MAKEKKKLLVPKWRFKGFAEGWKKMSYGEIYTFHTTNSYSRDNLNYEAGLVKNIHYGDIHTKFSTLFDIQKEYVPFVNTEIDISKIKEECYCQEKDLVIADASEDYADIGKTIELINLNKEKIIAGLHTFLARPSKHEMAKGFAGYLVQTWNVRKQVMTIAQGTKVLSISTGRLALLKLNIPALPEQQKIASFLSAIDQKLQQLQRKKELLEHYKKGVMQQLFSGKLRFKDEKGKAYPKWEEKTLEAISLKVQDGTHFSPKSLDQGEFFYLTSKNIKNGYIDLSSAQFVSKADHDAIYKRCDIRRGDVLLTKDGTIGQVCVNNLDKPFSLLSSVAFIRTNKDCDNYFLYQVLVSPVGQREISNSIAGQALKRITLTKIKNFKFLFPVISEQQKIANYLTSIDKKVELIKTQLKETETFKKGLLQQLFV